MKDFIKFTLATVAGLVLTGCLFFAGFFFLVGIIAASSEPTVSGST